MPGSKYDRFVFDVIGDGIWRDLGAQQPSRRAPERDLEITDVTCTVVDGNFPWNLIVVETDGDVYGIGEAFPGPVAEHVAFLATGLVGHNPLDVDRLAEHMTQLLSGLGGADGYAQAAVSGIETALWDIAGKVTELPVYQLLGGKYRDAVDVYVDCHAGEALSDAPAADPYEVYDPAAYAETAQAVLAEGFDALKFDLDVAAGDTDTAPRRLSNAAVEHKVDIVDAVRAAIGSEPTLGFDLHWNFSVETAVHLAEQLEPYDLAWLEDPVPPDSVETHRRVTDRTSTRILTGENLTRVEGFLPYLEAGALDIAAPDLQNCGGLLEFRKIATVADAYGVPLAPHNISSPVGTVASVHACAATPNAFLLEWHAREVDWWDDLHTGDPLIADSSIVVPEDPGLGIALDPDALGDHLAEGETLPGVIG